MKFHRNALAPKRFSPTAPSRHATEIFVNKLISPLAFLCGRRFHPLWETQGRKLRLPNSPVGPGGGKRIKQDDSCRLRVEPFLAVRGCVCCLAHSIQSGKRSLVDEIEREREDIQSRCRSKFFKHKSLTLYAHLRNRWKRSIEDGSHIIINDKSAHGTCPNSAAHQQLTLIKVCVLFRLWCAVKSFITLTGRGRKTRWLSLPFCRTIFGDGAQASGRRRPLVWVVSRSPGQVPAMMCGLHVSSRAGTGGSSCRCAGMRVTQCRSVGGHSVQCSSSVFFLLGRNIPFSSRIKCPHPSWNVCFPPSQNDV